DVDAAARRASDLRRTDEPAVRGGPARAEPVVLRGVLPAHAAPARNGAGAGGARAAAEPGPTSAGLAARGGDDRRHGDRGMGCSSAARRAGADDGEGASPDGG